MQYTLDDKEFGNIILTIRRGMTRIVFRWKNSALHMSAPYGVSAETLRNALDAKRESLRAMKPDGVKFYAGQVIPCFRTQITISTDARLRNQVCYGRNPDGTTLYLNVPEGTDFEKENVKSTISSAISDLLGRNAAQFLIPYAQAEAARLGLKPLRFEIGRGMRKLGHCTRDGVIQLSRHLLLLPEPLVQCVVCHELAHLTHMDHSPAFHALLDRYLGGRRALLDRQLDYFAWPIYR